MVDLTCVEFDLMIGFELFLSVWTYCPNLSSFVTGGVFQSEVAGFKQTVEEGFNGRYLLE